MVARCASNLVRGADATGGRQSTGGSVALVEVVGGGVVVAMPLLRCYSLIEAAYQQGGVLIGTGQVGQTLCLQHDPRDPKLAPQSLEVLWFEVLPSVPSPYLGSPSVGQLLEH